MLPCPHCQSDIDLAKLPHPSLFASHRLCPKCNKAFTVDPITKVRQGVAIFIALIALLLTGLMYFEGTEWLFHSLLSYAILGSIIWWGNKRVQLVPYEHTNLPPNK